ncbi:unnamed protein product [Rotaria socialis]|uniref:Ig-like domain-containing protein n=1 Tax=Rotaria socialis TaxID=392032 RepID=A0A818JK46_9BILA|nr:unnamed protein product [Rotaria socialis]CAF3539870.1 unnamed protein product [Rotaria socialis]CAF4235346.1 unnamed protein product [Rotaria socialis]CAF4490849.1 unnamed protein product [Rotaria socialis]
MHNDLMLLYSLFFLSIIIRITHGQQTVIYVKRGDVVELCDNRSTSIYAYEYRSFDGKKDLILEPSRNDRYSNPYRTSLLRINNVNESDSGLYKCPQDDIEWQKLQVYTPVKHIYLSNLHAPTRMYNNDLCGIHDRNCLVMVEGEPLDIVCAADGSPRPSLEISLNKNHTTPTIMALATGIKTPDLIDNRFQPSVYEVYRIPHLTYADNGRNLTCHVDMKHIDNTLILSVTKQIYIEYRPTVAEKVKKIYSGINRTRTVNCTVIRANPMYIHYKIHALTPSLISKEYDDQNPSYYKFDITPTSIDQFRSFNVTANNSIGYDTCTYELIHGDVPDRITNCTLDKSTSNITITITCTKSYAQGDSDSYACILYEKDENDPERMFKEIARTKSCIFALPYTHTPVEYRIGALNNYGSLSINQHGYVIPLNQKTSQKASVFNKKLSVILGCIFGGAIVLVFLCCLCGTCHQDRSKLSTRNTLYQKDRYPRSSTESEALKPISDEKVLHLVSNGSDRHHQNGAVYDIPIHLNGKYSHQLTSPTSVYHQQKSQQSTNLHYIDQDSITSSLNSLRTRARTFNNKFYGNPLMENKYGPLSSTIQGNANNGEIMENDEEDEDESPVYSTTTDVMSESGSFLVSNSSSKRRAPPPPKPRYSTLSSLRLPAENSDKVPLPCPKPRSRSNSRTRLNNGSSDNSSYLYEERPVSSSDSGIGQSDVVCLPNGDTIRSGLVKSRQNSLQKHYTSPPLIQQPIKQEILTSPIVRGTEC